jgi:hypothetical protein
MHVVRTFRSAGWAGLHDIDVKNARAAPGRGQSQSAYLVPSIAVASDPLFTS